MSDVKPMREEDYQAMAERARRAEAQMAQLREAMRADRTRSTARRMRVAMAAIALSGAVVAMVFMVRFVYAWVTAPGKNPTPCYFTAQPKYTHGVESPPWVAWYIWRANSADNDILEDAGTFKTQDDAWQFLQSKHVPVCQ